MARKLNKTLFAVALVSTGALSGSAFAQVQGGIPTVNKVFAPSANDPARVNGNRLRKTDEEFTNEQMSFAIGAGNKGVAIEMHSSEAINPFVTPAAKTLPPGNGNRMQGACAPIELAKSAAGPTEAKAVGEPLFLTANNGNEYRNFNHPRVMPINDGKNFLVLYNAQLNSNDTKRYAMVVDATCKTIPVTGGQTGQAAPTRTNPGAVVMAKNNDDCAMMQDGRGEEVVSSVGGVTKVVSWAGCNGNGADDGWAFRFKVNCQLDAAGAATSCAVVKGNGDDVSVEAEEERTHGSCTTGKDKNTAICTWTKGNNQPQRGGVWVGAVDVTDGAPMKVLWKKQIDGRQELAGEGRVYSMRAMHTRVLEADGSPSDTIFFRYGLVEGNNNNNKKGGEYKANQMALLKVSRTEQAVPVVAPTNFASKVVGQDGTHLAMCNGLVGTKKAPGFALVSGSMIATGNAQVRFVTTDGSQLSVERQVRGLGAAYDIHLYSNYLGNNPGNQGRNFLDCQIMADPFNPGQNILIAAMTGKDSKDTLSSIKPSGFLSTITVAAPAPAAGAGQSGAGTAAGDAVEPDSTVAGCSAGTGSSGLASLLLLGLVGLLRRRR